MPKLSLLRLKSLLLILVLWFAACAAAQAPVPAPAGEAAKAAAAPEPSKSEKKRKEPRISPAEAEELFRSVDQILKFVSDDTGLPIKHPVKRALATREQVEEFMRDAITKDDRRSEVVLKKFGLLPRELDLSKFLVDLMGEQVAGYYDTKSKTMYLLDWVRPEAQKPVLVHELTHALQDQNFDLEKWLHPGRGKDDLDDEASTTRRAVSEGQAMVTLLDYTLQPSGRSLAFAPEIVAQFRRLNADNPDFPLLKSAPLMLQEALSFPYSYGLGFEYELLLNGGKKRAFADVFRDPPKSTREVMEPETYLKEEELPPLSLPELKHILNAGYKRYDHGAVGEFDVYVILKQFAGEKEAAKMAKKWRGGVYLACTKKDDKAEADKPADPADVALLYVSRWATAEDARRFAEDYAAVVTKKYQAAKAVEQGDPAVRAWKTEEGPVFIQVDGDRVLVSESYDEATAAKLRAVVLAQPVPALRERR